MRSLRRGASSTAIAVSLASLLIGIAPAAAQQVILVPAGTTDSTAKTVGGTDTITVESGATLTSTVNPTINWSTSSTDLRITNSGTISSTNATGRAINASGSSNVRTVTLTNNVGGVITSADDAFRINVLPTGGTITVNNFGKIQTTTAGQALDFDAVASGATIIINNAAGAELRSFGQDAIRPGQGAVVTNASLIFSDGAPNNSFDGVDWQGRSGQVINQGGGTISGLRHGITSDVAVDVNNAGTIVGRNGSGIGSDGTGTVVNTGTITGQWDGVATNGDGDGVDIDLIGSVTNSGIIQGLSATGVDSGGRPNSAEGIAMGGGTIVNNTGGLVFGAGNAILINHDTNPGGVADGATTITNAGVIRAGTGRAIQLVGAFADTITNSRTITGGTAGAIDMGDGNDTLNLLTGSFIDGTVDGGAGTDTIRLGVVGGTNVVFAGTFAGAINFESLTVNSGTWMFTGAANVANGMTIAANGGAYGTTATLSGTIVNAGELTFDQSVDGTFSGAISGTGNLLKAGTGIVTLGAQTYTGATTVVGTLVLTGNLASGTYNVNSNSILTSALSATISTTAPTVTITNSGTISTTNASGRAINLAGPNNTRDITLTNNAGAVITSADDAFRINFAPTGGTITVNNVGTIQTTGGGQALDFDAVAGNATVIINNLASGVLKSFGQDAIRPGQGAVVTNAGLIFSDGAPNNSFDGVDWQGRSGTVNNQATGTISGLRHGITSDIAVNVANAGTILGRNGSGIGSDGTGTVVNTGTITGQWDGVATNGDGDGVDIDLIGSVTNSGTIQGLSATGVDSGGRPNSAEGIAIGGGTIVNNAGATVFGAGNAILINHDTNVGGVADGATTITTAGTIRAGGGRAIQLVGAFADTITNSGTITGGTAGAIDMGDGNDTLNLLTGSVITGTVDGGAGTDAIVLGGTGSGTFAGAVNFESLAVASGNWTLASLSGLAGGLSIGASGSLTGDTSTLTGPIANAGTLTFNQTTDGTFGGTLTGSGQLVKAGAGALTVGNQTGFTGATSINAGKLILAGTLPSAVTVASGGTLAGVGTVASLTVASGGTVAPGNSPGTITVTGNFAQAAGSTYLAETTAAGASDRIFVNGTATIGAGAQLNVTRDTGIYTLGTRYTLLTATGGITGTYALVQTASGGTEFRLVQTGTGIFVDVARSGAFLTGLAQTPNQIAVAPAFAALTASNGAYAALTMVTDDTAVRAGFDALSGEVHASARTAAVMDVRAADDAIRSRLGVAVEGTGLWVQAIRRDGSDDGVGGTGATDRNAWSGVGGIDFAAGGFRAGLAAGYTSTKLNLAARASSARIKTTHALAYAGGTFGQLSLRGGVGYAWVKNEVSRSVTFTGFSDALSARYDSDVLHGFGEVGLALPALGGTVEPFGGIAAYRIHSDAFGETGGAAALSGTAHSETFTQSSLGLRVATPVVGGLQARASAAWAHTFGDTRPDASLRFTSGAVPFTVTGAGLSRNAAALSLDLDATLANNVTLSAGYAGTIGDRGNDSSLHLGLAIAF
jgi:uncharacterized protein with beta-barrel porin domain